MLRPFFNRCCRCGQEGMIVRDIAPIGVFWPACCILAGVSVCLIIIRFALAPAKPQHCCHEVHLASSVWQYHCHKWQQTQQHEYHKLPLHTMVHAPGRCKMQAWSAALTQTRAMKIVVFDACVRGCKLIFRQAISRRHLSCSRLLVVCKGQSYGLTSCPSLLV